MKKDISKPLIIFLGTYISIGILSIFFRLVSLISDSIMKYKNYDLIGVIIAGIPITLSYLFMRYMSRKNSPDVSKKVIMKLSDRILILLGAPVATAISLIPFYLFILLASFFVLGSGYTVDIGRDTFGFYALTTVVTGMPMYVSIILLVIIYNILKKWIIKSRGEGAL